VSNLNLALVTAMFQRQPSAVSHQLSAAAKSIRQSAFSTQPDAQRRRERALLKRFWENAIRFRS
jgi:isochorismate hydrolase